MKRTKSFRITTAARRLHKLRPLLFLLFAGILLFFGLRFVYPYIAKRYFIIKSITISGKTAYAGNKDLKEVAVSALSGKDLNTLDVEKFVNSYKSSFLALKEVNLVKKYPSAVVIDVVEREPSVIVRVRNSENYYLIDIDGFILGLADPNGLNLPIFEYSGGSEVAVGKFLEGAYVKSFNTLISSLKEINLDAAFVEVSTGKIEVKTKNGVLIIFPILTSYGTKAAVLKEVIKKYALENIALKKVDLRYDNVVVEY